ncbi:MAG: methyltransferase domain-containing protein, partial [Candidatus Moraniibacteriota bacterium]
MKDVKAQYLNYLNSKEGALKYNEFKNILYGKKDSLISNLFDIIYPKIKNKKELEILDIGGGDGKRLRHLLALFKQRKIATRANLLEPSEEFVKSCVKESSKKKYPINVEKSTFEKFSTKSKYDIIFLIHSIYTFRNNAYLDKIKKMLSDDGLVVFIVNDTNSFLGGLKKITDNQYASSRNEVDSLLDGLGGYECKIKKFDTIFSGVVAKNKKLNKNGNLILEWIGMRHLYDISSEIKESARNFFIKRQDKNGYIH